MDISESKKCPFNCKECMEEDCRLYDEESETCEFEGMSRFIGECFDYLIKRLETYD